MASKILRHYLKVARRSVRFGSFPYTLQVSAWQDLKANALYLLYTRFWGMRVVAAYWRAINNGLWTNGCSWDRY